jgi:hypothetical protein
VNLKRDIQLAGNNIQGDFSIVLGGQTFDKRTEAGDKIFTMAETLGNEAGDSIKIGTFKGFKVGLQRDGYREIQLVLEGSNSYSTKISDNNAGNTIRLENMIERLPGELTKEERDLELNLQQLEESKVAVKTPFEYEQRLSSASTEQVEIETQLEFDKSKSEDVITSDVTENTMEVSPMANDIANRKPNAKTPAAELNDAIKENDDARLDQLLSSGVDVQKLYNDTTFLHIAVENDSYECAKKLLNHGVYADGFNKLLETPLYTAVEKNNIDMADLLLDSGANPELCVKGVQIQDYSKSAEMDQLIMDHNLDRNKGDGQTRGKTR